MIRLWHVSMEAGLLAPESHPSQGGLVGLVTDLMERLGAPGAGLAVAARLPLIKLSDIDKTEAWFARHGVKTVFFGRMIPIFRSLISIPAGVERMPIATFLLYTTLGSLIWNSVFVMAGYRLGENWHSVEPYRPPGADNPVQAVRGSVYGTSRRPENGR